MSGVLGVLAASATSSIYSVTVADLSFGAIWGYNPPNGAISATAFKSTTINNVSSHTSSPRDIGIVLDGALTQSYFSALVVQRTDGAIRRYATADASFLVFGGDAFSSWIWDNNDPAWTATGTRFLILYA